jgi:hypothetical protein
MTFSILVLHADIQCDSPLFSGLLFKFYLGAEQLLRPEEGGRFL